MEVTLAARPEALQELDDFGSLQGDTGSRPALEVDDDPTITVRAEAPRQGSDPRPVPPSPSERAEAIRKAVMALQAEHAAAVSAVGQPRLSIATPQRERQGGELLPYLALIVIFLTGVAAILIMMQREPEMPPIPPLPPKVEAPVVEPEPEPPPPLGATADTVLPQLVENGFEIVNLGGKMVIDDGGSDGAITVAETARFIRVLGGGASGWLVLSELPGSAGVAWIGSLQGGRWRARGISINDCPAQVRVQPVGVEVEYAKRRVLLPHGGGPLKRVSVERPSFADRVEVQPLGLAFGAAEGGRGTVHCSAGWDEAALVLERMPPGEYTLLWMGDGRVDEAALIVDASAPSAPPRRERRRRTR